MSDNSPEGQPDNQNPEGTGNDKGYNLDTAVEKIRELRDEAKQHRLKAEAAETERDTFKSQLEEVMSKATGLETELAKFADYDELKQKVETLSQESRTKDLTLSLKGLVTDENIPKAFKLMDNSILTGEDQLDVEAFLKENPFLAAKSVTNPASNKGTSKDTVNTIEDISKLSHEEQIAFFDKLPTRR